MRRLQIERQRITMSMSIWLNFTLRLWPVAMIESVLALLQGPWCLRNKITEYKQVSNVNKMPKNNYDTDVHFCNLYASGKCKWCCKKCDFVAGFELTAALVGNCYYIKVVFHCYTIAFITCFHN
jgi:hypothetical protein